MVRIGAVDIGGTHIKACLFQDGVVGAVQEVDTNAKEGGAAVIARAASMLEVYGTLEAIGVSTGGQVANGTIQYANDNVPGYTGFPVERYFAERFGVPVAVENDVNAAAVGESAYGAAMGEPNVVCLTYGTGVGGALMLDGKLYKGSHNAAGEFGGIVVHPEAVTNADILSGCYERYASATALVARAMLLDETLDTGRKLFARLEEPQIRAVVDAWVKEVVHGICTLVHVYDPTLVVLGGGVLAQPYVLEEIQKQAFSRLIPAFRGVRIVSAALGNRAGLYGAMHLAAEKRIACKTLS